MSSDQPHSLPMRHHRNTSLEDQPQHRNASGLLAFSNLTSGSTKSDGEHPVIELSDSDRESSQDLQASTSRLPTRPRSLNVSPPQQRSSRPPPPQESRDDTGPVTIAAGLKRKKSADSLGERTPLKALKEGPSFGLTAPSSFLPDESADEIDFLTADTSLALAFRRAEGSKPFSSRMALRGGNNHLGSESLTRGSLANTTQRSASASSMRKTNGKLKLPHDEEIELELEWVSFSDVDAYLNSEEPVIRYLPHRHDFRLQCKKLQGSLKLDIAISDLTEIELTNDKTKEQLIIHLRVESMSPTATMVSKASPEWDSRSSRRDLICLVPDEAAAAYGKFRAWLHNSKPAVTTFVDKAGTSAIISRAETAVERKKRILKILPQHTTPLTEFKTSRDAKVTPESGFSADIDTERRDLKPTARKGTLFTDTDQTISKSSTKAPSICRPDSSRPKARPAATATYAADRQTRSTSGGRHLHLPPKSGEPAQALMERRRPQRTADNLKLRYPFDGPGSVSIFESDCDRLEEGEFLNDTLVEFGLKHSLSKIQEKNPALYDSMYVFNTFLYRQLTKVRGKQDVGYQQVRKWTTKANIFDKQFLVIPINENLHWYLAIVVNPGKALDTLVKEEEVVSSGNGIATVTTRRAHKSTMRSTPEDDLRSRRSGTAGSLAFSTPEPPQAGRPDAKEDQQDEMSTDVEGDKTLSIAPEETGVETSYSQMSIRTKEALDASSGDDAGDISAAPRNRKLNFLRDEITAADTVEKLLEDHRNESGDKGKGLTSHSLSPSPPSEPEPIESGSQGIAEVLESRQKSYDGFIPPGLNRTIFGRRSSVGVDLGSDMSDGQGNQQGDEGFDSSKTVPLFHFQKALAESRTESDANGKTIAISDDEEDDGGNDVPMQDMDGVNSNIHNTGRGTIFGGGPFLPEVSSGGQAGPSSSSLSAPTRSSDATRKKSPAVIIIGESQKNWRNSQQSPAQSTNRPQAKPVVSKSDASTSEAERSAHGAGTDAASTTNFYGSKPSSGIIASGIRRVQTYAKPVAGGNSRRRLSDKTERGGQSVVTLDDDSESGVPESSQEPVPPGRQKPRVPFERATADLDPTAKIDIPKGRPPRVPSAAVLSAINKRREQLEGLVVLTFDSLGGKHSAVATTVKNYLRNEALDKKGIRIDPQPAYIDVNVPGQSNWCDCGLFVLLYFDRFFSNPSHFLQDIIPERDDEAQAWDAESAVQARMKLRNLIENLSAEFQERKKKAEEEAKAADGDSKEGVGKEESDSQSDDELVPLDAQEVEREREREREKEQGERECDKDQAEDTKRDDQHDRDVASFAGPEAEERPNHDATSSVMAGIASGISAADWKDDDDVGTHLEGRRSKKEKRGKSKEGDGCGDGSEADDASMEANPSTSPI